MKECVLDGQTFKKHAVMIIEVNVCNCPIVLYVQMDTKISVTRLL